MLKGANIEGEDEQEETIQDMEGSVCCNENCATLHLSKVEMKSRLRFHFGSSSFSFSLLRIKRNSLKTYEST